MKNFYMLLFFYQTFSFSQNSDSIPKSNPIIYIDLTIAMVREQSAGLSASTSLNYQIGNSLITARILQIAVVESWFLFIPITGTTINEIGLLYGRRYINEGESYSFSAGIAALQKSSYTVNQPNNVSNYFGVPFELNYSFFKAKKKRFRIIYGLVPIGKPTALGRSIGFKLLGNFSKNSFFGIGISSSLGWHKKY